jgi:hypothetical protein
LCIYALIPSAVIQDMVLIQIIYTQKVCKNNL